MSRRYLTRSPTPLGSLWKLYVYAWLEDTHQPEQPYQCRGNPGRGLLLSGWESITRDTALVRSCGLYFAPQRLHIGADVWGNTGNSVRHLRVSVSTTLKPETSVTVKSLLDSLATLPAQNKACGSLTGCGAGRGENRCRIHAPVVGFG